MKCLPELYEQLTHLTNNIKQCNYTSYNERQDIIHDALEKIIIKFNEGVLEDDFNKIKGYTFITVRNFCSAYHIKKKPTYTDEPLEIEGDFVHSYEETDYKNYIHNVVNKFLLDRRYTKNDRQVCDLMLNNIEDKEIKEIMGITSKELAAIRQALKTKLKFDAEKKPKYVIKNTNYKEFEKYCYSRNEVIDFFEDYHKYYVHTIIQTEKITRQGYYVKTLIKKKWGREKKTS